MQAITMVWKCNADYAAAGHRREAFEAADFLMDYLKSRAPFWKKEIGPAGERWVEPTDRDRSDVARWD